MFWKVRALMEDRPGALAALAGRCGDRRVNILGLQIFPAGDGRVVDELVLHTPGGWADTDVHELCALAGVRHATVVACSAHALEDQPVRYVRAAQVVMDDPGLLEDQLCRLLEAVPADTSAEPPTLLLDDEDGPEVRLTRALPFTDGELARAVELRRLAGVVLGRFDPLLPAAGPVPGSPVLAVRPTLRRGTAADARALADMHLRCSTGSVHRRYHSPLSRLSMRLARSLLEPAGGVSLVLTVGEEVVAHGLVAPGPDGAEAGLLVEDRWQRHGLGAGLLRALAEEAADLGLDALTCMVQPGNPAVLQTIRRAELHVRVSRVDGLDVYRVPLRGLRRQDGAAARGRPAMGEVTTPLVALLHGRRELRDVSPAADLIDQAVRGGA